MANPEKLSRRQEIFLKRAGTVTREQLDMAQNIAKEVLGLEPEDASNELIVGIAQVIATNFHASLSDNNAPD